MKHELLLELFEPLPFGATLVELTGFAALEAAVATGLADRITDHPSDAGSFICIATINKITNESKHTMYIKFREIAPDGCVLEFSGGSYEERTMATCRFRDLLDQFAAAMALQMSSAPRPRRLAASSAAATHPAVRDYPGRHAPGSQP